jgi:proteasome lid subunit RPN8/RPN11
MIREVEKLTNDCHDRLMIFYHSHMTYGKYLTRAKLTLMPLSELPAAKILPSDPMPRAMA